MMGSQTASAENAMSALTTGVIDTWFARAEVLQHAESRLNSADLAAGSPASMPSMLDYGRLVLRDAVDGSSSSTQAPPVPQTDAQACVLAYLTAMAAGVRAASAIHPYFSDEVGANSDQYPGVGAAPIAVAAGLLAGAAALAEASDRCASAEHQIWAPEAAAAAAGAAAAADTAADGADLGMTARLAARAARNIHHGPTRVYLILTALADVVAPPSVTELLIDSELAGTDLGGFRIAFSMDSSRWATPQTLATALTPQCSAFECDEESGVCDVDLLTDSPGPVMEMIISLGTPYHLEIEHLEIEHQDKLPF